MSEEDAVSAFTMVFTRTKKIYHKGLWPDISISSKKKPQELLFDHFGTISFNEKSNTDLAEKANTGLPICNAAI